MRVPYYGIWAQSRGLIQRAAPTPTPPPLNCGDYNMFAFSNSQYMEITSGIATGLTKFSMSFVKNQDDKNDMYWYAEPTNSDSFERVRFGISGPNLFVGYRDTATGIEYSLSVSHDAVTTNVAAS